MPRLGRNASGSPVGCLEGANALATLDIRLQGDPVLRKIAKPVKKVGPAVRSLLKDMAETMYAANGVGLAAPQVGIAKRIIVVDAGDGLMELVNPELIRAEGQEVGVEGCLSIPGLIGEVERFAKVTVTCLDHDGRQRWIEGEGLLARVLQHEIDHLNGVLFTDKALAVHEARSEGEEGEEDEGEAAEAAEGAESLEEAGPEAESAVSFEVAPDAARED